MALPTGESYRIVSGGTYFRLPISPFDLDDAVLRRLPRRLLIDLPGPAEREGENTGAMNHVLLIRVVVTEILKILLRDEKVSSDVDLAALAKRTDAFSGSDLKRAHLDCS